MMKLLLLMSSLRSGSHMVRSMLRADAGIVDLGGEHRPLTPADAAALAARPRTSLVALKYGFLAPTPDCLALAGTADACALVLHRRDGRAQALSLASARANGTWFGPSGRGAEVVVSEDEAARQAARNTCDRDAIRRALTIPHAVLAYEDITPATLAAALGPLLGRPVTVVAPATVKTRREDVPHG